MERDIACNGRLPFQLNEYCFIKELLPGEVNVLEQDDMDHTIETSPEISFFLKHTIIFPQLARAES